MTRKLALKELQIEASGLASLLERAKEFDDPVAEFQLNHRIEDLNTKVSELESESEPLANVGLFFDGNPVLGSRGIAAEFAGNVLEQFQELVSHVYAQTEMGLFGRKGPVPYKDLSRLMITGTATGSFGFVLSELSDQTQVTNTALNEVLAQSLEFINHTASIDENDFLTVRENLSPRSFKVLTQLFKVLDNAQSTLRVVEDKIEYALDHSAISRARRRTEATEVEEIEEVLSGIIRGTLPGHLKIEMSIDGEDVYGSLSREAADQYEIYKASSSFDPDAILKVKVIRRYIRTANNEPKVSYKVTELLD